MRACVCMYAIVCVAIAGDVCVLKGVRDVIGLFFSVLRSEWMSFCNLLRIFFARAEPS